MALDEVLEAYPTLDRADVVAAMRLAGRCLLDAA